MAIADNYYIGKPDDDVGSIALISIVYNDFENISARENSVVIACPYRCTIFT